jgi:hypothetical protein
MCVYVCIYIYAHIHASVRSRLSGTSIDGRPVNTLEIITEVAQLAFIGLLGIAVILALAKQNAKEKRRGSGS